MAGIRAESSRNGVGSSRYAKGDTYKKKTNGIAPVMVTAIGAPVQGFEDHLLACMKEFKKDGHRQKQKRDASNKIVRDENGKPVIERDTKGRILYEPRYLQTYNFVLNYGLDELDPDDPESWNIATANAKAFFDKWFPDHPVLLAVETNGQSGLVHVHGILWAVNPKTGLSLDSNRVTQAQLVLNYNETLREQGFAQREDLVQIEENLKVRMAAVEEQVRARGLGPADENRVLIAACKTVKPIGLDTKNRADKHEQRRQREFDRYEVNEIDRATAKEFGVEGPPERFSEIVLERRAKAVLADPRFTSWAELSALARESRVTIVQRGNDVSIGMMREQGDGTEAEPTKVDIRRGSKLNGLALDDIEAAIERNIELAEEIGQQPVEVDEEVRSLADLIKREGEFNAQMSRHNLRDSVDDVAEKQRQFEEAMALIAAEDAAGETDESIVEEVNDVDATAERLHAALDAFKVDHADLIALDELDQLPPAIAERLTRIKALETRTEKIQALEHLSTDISSGAVSLDPPRKAFVSALRTVADRTKPGQVRDWLHAVASLEERVVAGEELASVLTAASLKGVGRVRLDEYGEHLTNSDVRARLEQYVSKNEASTLIRQAGDIKRCDRIRAEVSSNNFNLSVADAVAAKVLPQIAAYDPDLSEVRDSKIRRDHEALALGHRDQMKRQMADVELALAEGEVTEKQALEWSDGFGDQLDAAAAELVEAARQAERQKQSSPDL